MTSEPMIKPKAYSYLRFSTPEQSKGDSYRRQSDLAQAYAVRHALDLDDTLTFHDLGVSAYRGSNIETGKLGYFLEAVRVGQVLPGSYLLVESLDRISRQAARKAARVLEEICDAGITLVTLIDDKAYTAESLDEDPLAFLFAVLIFMRGNEESATKARRLKSAWERKRATASDRPMTSRAPAWLKLEGDHFTVIGERAEIVRRMFGDTLQGCSPHSIAEALNVECVPVFGRGKYWHRSYVVKILANAAVIGTVIPHTEDSKDGKRVRVALEPIAGYYPPIIDPDSFYRVQSLRMGALSPLRGRHASKEVSNIFGGLAKCARCGGSMTRINKGGSGRTPWVYLVCAAAKTGAGCHYEAQPYAPIEQALLMHGVPMVANAPTGAGNDELDRQIEKAALGVEALDDHIGELLNSQMHRASPIVARRIRELEAHRDEAEKELDGLRARSVATSGLLVQSKIRDLIAALDTVPLNRTLVNTLLRQTFERIDVDIDNGTLLFTWRHGGESELPYNAKGYGFTVEAGGYTVTPKKRARKRRQSLAS